MSSRPVQTFCIGFEETGYDESPYARQVAGQLGTEHHELRVGPIQALQMVPSLPLLYDEPFADSSQIPTWLVSQLARTKVTVALSGDGGDEIFGGYNRYSWGPTIWNRLRWLPVRLRGIVATILAAIPMNSFIGIMPQVAYPHEKITKLLQLVGAPSASHLYKSLVSHWHAPEKLVVGGAEPNYYWPDDLSSAARMMRLDAQTYLPDDILVKVDRASMGVSLECRAPFLDPQVTEVAWRLPAADKIRGSTGKVVLRQILAQYVKPLDRPKAGFSLPLGQWLRGPLREWAADLLNPASLAAHLHPQPITHRWNEHLRGHRDWSSSLWCVLMFQAWSREWLNGSSGPRS